MMTAKLAVIVLSVEQLGRAVRFYVESFDWPVTIETPNYVELALPDGMRLGLYDRQAFAHNVKQLPPAPPTTITGCELYLYVDDIGAAIARLLQSGARMLSEPQQRDWGDEVAYVADLDANVIAIARPAVLN